MSERPHGLCEKAETVISSSREEEDVVTNMLLFGTTRTDIWTSIKDNVMLRWLLLIYDDPRRGLLAIALLIDVDKQSPARPCRSGIV